MSDTWQRVTERAEFVALVADRALAGEGLTFSIRSDGTLGGHAGQEAFSGNWAWRDGMFCRTATMGGESLGHDCEVIEISGDRMRYTRDAGAGPASIVRIGPASGGRT